MDIAVNLTELNKLSDIARHKLSDIPILIQASPSSAYSLTHCANHFLCFCMHSNI